jgi:DNA invertase Pin-like site-specific DNA recombinase
MSTEHQRYSTENQRAAIGAYAVHRDIEIVRTYEDKGRSGLRLEGRPALQGLLSAVQGARADFDLVLVYDVSRWGRFQDADESAHYEFLCRKAGVEVRYCAEVFENDGSITATLLKTMKRAMAGEYSRELSEKVAAGHRHHAESGFWQGGDPGFGLRRALIAPDGTILQPMERGQRKAIQDRRTTIIAGPKREAEAVRLMFDTFTQLGLGETAIAEQLNSQGIDTPEGGPWTRRRVHSILVKPRYAGILVYNRSSERLTGARVANSRETWVEREGAFEALIPLQTFRLAQRRIETRRSRSDADLIEALRRIHTREGRVTRALIRDDPECPAASVFAKRFGTLMHAYRVAGLTAVKDVRYLVGLHLRLVMATCDRVMVLNLGQKIAEGAPDAVRRDPAVIAAYLGIS